jgi:uncharacterized protein (TIGR02246 family)
MRRSLVAFTLLLSLPSLALAAPRDDAEAAYENFFTVFAAGDPEAVVALFAPDGQFWGTTSPELVTTIDGIRAYFVAGMRGPTLGPVTQVIEPSVIMLSDEVAIVSGVWQYTRADGVVRGPFRNSVVIANSGQGWQIVQFHNSPMPAPPAPAAPAPGATPTPR